jgi:Flp pilus assembly protein CpaB
VNRSNRLVILVGVLLAVLAFVLVVIMLNQPDGAGDGGEEVITETVLVATEDIDIGEEVTPAKVRAEQVDPEAVIEEPLRSVSQVSGQPALFAIPAESQVTAQAIGLVEGPTIDIAGRLNAGEKAIAFQVDRATGLDFLVTEGDFIDIVLSQQISVLQETADSAANTDETAPPRFEVVTGLENQRTVKAILQDKRVIYVSGTKATQAEPIDVNNDGQITPEEQPAEAVLESVIIVFAGTDQDAELIKYAQNDFSEVGALTAVVRHADDDAVEETLGITIDQLVEQFGLRIPGIVETLDTTEETP